MMHWCIKQLKWQNNTCATEQRNDSKNKLTKLIMHTIWQPVKLNLEKAPLRIIFVSKTEGAGGFHKEWGCTEYFHWSCYNLMVNLLSAEFFRRNLVLAVIVFSLLVYIPICIIVCIVVSHLLANLQLNFLYTKWSKIRYRTYIVSMLLNPTMHVRTTGSSFVSSNFGIDDRHLKTG